MAEKREGARRAARSRCGVYDCSACALYRSGRCPGCASGNLRLRREGEVLCPVYQCVRTLRIAGCEECRQDQCLLDRRAALRCQLRVRFGGERTSPVFLQQIAATRATGTGGAGHAWRQSGDRLRGYLGVLVEYQRQGVEVLSSHQLARGTGVRASLVRRDLAELGGLGTPGKGYAAEALAGAIRGRLDLARKRAAVWLGVGERTDWAAAIEELGAVNCALVGVFDDRNRGRVAGKLQVQPLSKVVAEVRRTGATVAVVASGRAARRNLLEDLAEAGVRGILNLTPCRLDLSGRVVVEQCDLGSELTRLVSRLGGGGRGQQEKGKHGARSAAR